MYEIQKKYLLLLDELVLISFMKDYEFEYNRNYSKEKNIDDFLEFCFEDDLYID